MKETSSKPLFTSFTCLNVTQFCSALNDNVYKLLLVFMLITLRGPEQSNLILSIAGFIFVLPFLLFSTYSGILADRFSKRSLVYCTRILEIIIVSLGVVAIALESAILGYSVLFLLAAQSTLFSPAKYGIIPEIVKREDISQANGMLTATTYLAIILGTFMGSFLSEITNRNFVLASLFCMGTALIGAFFSLGIKKTQPQATEKKSNPLFLIDLYKTLKKASKVRYLLPAIIFGAFFLFMGSYTQLNIIPFALQSLHLQEIQGGYLFLATAIGIGIGSYLIGKILGKDCELSFVPLSTLCMAAMLQLLYYMQHSLIAVTIVMIFLGILGGIFTVSIDIFIQVASPHADRGQNVAASNFLSFGGVFLSSGLLFLFGAVLRLSAAEGFFYLSWVTYLLGLILACMMIDQILRLGVAIIAKCFWNCTIEGPIPEYYKQTTLVLCKRNSWLDTVVMMAILPRQMRYIVPESKKKKHRFLFRFFALIPTESKHTTYVSPHTLTQIKHELKLGHSVCVMYPKEHTPKELIEAWKQAFDEKELLNHLPMVTSYISRHHQHHSTGYLKQYLSLFSAEVTVHYDQEKRIDL